MSFYNILLFFLLIFNFQTQHYYIDSLIDNKQYMVAEKAIINSIKENPNSEILIKKLGDCYGFIKDWDNAIIQYQKLIELDSDNSVYNILVKPIISSPIFVVAINFRSNETVTQGACPAHL